ncbi:carbohydrate ABC transporter permease [Clostridium folliculivorans]|uniref:Sugar ABC transporter permease n=1 Tax=Clostridium folliculivorans TaxID=2886038 RepID=A0A9W5Y698_9CLOT|nr:carbohydrate ABC transporter permease [Clostridium folliculivorans]GKU27334.1 sugar ABC transporter permease [Clostridium folliculivorans]GKU32185.1 sugar ABC transporter permease [Clostridium folliculivorans]
MINNKALNIKAKSPKSGMDLKYKIKYIVSDVFKYSTLILGAAITIVPILVILFTSFKTSTEYQTTGPLTLPSSFNFNNYVTAFIRGNMVTGFKNTAIILVISLFGKILLGTMIAYVLHRFKFRGKKVILGLFLFAMLVPTVSNQVVVFKIIAKIGLFNKIGSILLLNLGTDVISMYIFLQFLDKIPVALDESAMLDGASYFTIYTRIILPLLRPAIATVVILSGVGIYNDFYTPFLYMPDPKLRTISTALFNFKGPMGSQWEIIAAGIMIVIIPTLVIFISLQKHIYNGVQGSVK